MVDAGAYNTLQVQVAVQPGTGNANDYIYLQHAAVNEDHLFIDLVAIPVGQPAWPGTLVTVSDFLRYVRWMTPPAWQGANPTVQIDVIAKE